MTKRVFVCGPSRAGINAVVNQAPDGWIVTIAEPGKSRAQEKRYHAMIAEIAEQFEFCGRKWDKEDMKRLLLDQFRRDTVGDPDYGEAWK